MSRIIFINGNLYVEDSCNCGPGPAMNARDIENLYRMQNRYTAECSECRMRFPTATAAEHEAMFPGMRCPNDGAIISVELVHTESNNEH